MIQEMPSGLTPGKVEVTRPRRFEACPQWRFQFTRGIEGLTAIEAIWEDLADSDPHLAFYQCPAWARAYLEHLAPDPEALVWVTGWRGLALGLVLPLEQFGSKLCLLHHDHMTLADALAPGLDDSIWPQLRAWLSGPKGPGNAALRFPAIPSHGVLGRWLELFPEPLSLLRNLDGSAWLSCERSYSEILKGASANHRSNLSRGLKRAEKLGPLRYESFSHPDELTSAMPHFLSIEASGWKGKQGGAVSCKAELVAFYKGLCSSLGTRQRCEIDLLWLGTDPIATIFWFRTGGTLHLQKIAYLEDHGELGPGRLIMAEALQRACADPSLHGVSFITRCPWADGWRTKIAPVCSWTLFPDTWRGRFAFTLNRAKISLKNRLRRLLKKPTAQAGSTHVIS